MPVQWTVLLASMVFNALNVKEITFWALRRLETHATSAQEVITYHLPRPVHLAPQNAQHVPYRLEVYNVKAVMLHSLWMAFNVSWIVQVRTDLPARPAIRLYAWHVSLDTPFHLAQPHVPPVRRSLIVSIATMDSFALNVLPIVT